MSSRPLPWILAGLVAGATVFQLASAPGTSTAAEPTRSPVAVPTAARDGEERMVTPKELESRRPAARDRAAGAPQHLGLGESDLTTYTFELSVVDGDDQPLSGAAVYLAPWPGPLSHAGVTDVRGRLRVQWTARRTSMRVAFAAAHPREGASNLRVVELTARPFAAMVELRPPSNHGVRELEPLDTPNPWSSADAHRARLDERGLLRFSAEAPGLPGAALELPRGWSFPAACAATSALPDVVPQAHAFGVAREPNGRPARGVRVRASEAMLDFELSTRSQDDGAFVLGPLPRDGAHVSVGGGDAGRYETELGFGVEPFQHLNPSLQRGREVVGRCIDAVGRPLQGWRVELSDPGSRPPWADMAWTVADGSFRVPNVPSALLRIDLLPPGSRPSLPFAIARAVQAEDEILLDSSGGFADRCAITLDVLDAEGACVDRAEALLAPIDGDRAIRLEFDAVRRSFRARDLPAGRYALHVHAPNHRSIEREVGLVREGEVDLGTLRFEANESVVIELSGGLGATEVRLERADADPPLYLGSFQARGRWRMRLPAGDYVLYSREANSERATPFTVVAGRPNAVRIER
ncbi:MAG: hypothetical protein HZA53_03545 [Planctomycetes bacterium]|nr:hypothetical protein [Planctomycetota bacterium]